MDEVERKSLGSPETPGGQETQNDSNSLDGGSGESSESLESPEEGEGGGDGEVGNGTMISFGGEDRRTPGFGGKS